MSDRIAEELSLMRERWPDLEYRSDGRWILLPTYPPRPDGWMPTMSAIVFQIQPVHPGSPPYGFYVSAGITFRGQAPTSYTEPAATQPPFAGPWGFFSWSPDDGAWQPTADIRAGANLLNWALGFQRRFHEGA